jgi:outer membrane lipoprotein SlyB
METVQKSKIHPLAAGAAVAVIVAAGVGIAAMTGHLPGSNAEPAAAAQISAAPPPQVAAVQSESAEHRAAREQGMREEAARQEGAREQAARDRARHQQMADASQQPRAQARHCPNCGVVESVNAYQQKGEGGMVGIVGGGVAGALVGSQIGHGGGKTVAEIAGAAGGAYLGNEIEKKVHTTTHYNVVVRMDGGGSQTVSYATQPGFSAGSHVRVENGTLVQN